MAFPHAILLSLREQSGSGDGLARRFDAPLTAQGGIRTEGSAIRWLDELAAAWERS